MKNELFISLVIVFILVSFLFLVTLFRMYEARDFPSKVESLDPNTIETGDILNVSYRRPFGYFIVFWSASIWSHIGTAYRDPQTNELFILEAGNYSSEWNGIVKMPFKEWVKFNRKCDLSINRLQRNEFGKTNVDSTLLLEEFENMKSTRLQGISLDWYRLLLTEKYDGKIRDQATCYEISITLMQKAGVFQKKLSSNSYFPRNIVWCEIETEEGFKYEKPVMVDPRLYYANTTNLLLQN